MSTYKEMITDQHCAMLTAIDALIAVDPTTTPLVMLTELAKILVLVREHFLHEESMMRACDYFDYTNHKKSHDVFLLLLEDVYKDLTNDPKLIHHRIELVCRSVHFHINLEIPLFEAHIFNKYEKN